MREKRLILTLLGVTVFPHIFHLPLLLNLYLLLFVIYLIFSKNYRVGVIIFAILGVIFGGIEYVRYINITELSKAKIFIDIVSSLLIFITSLLVLDRIQSPFLKLAPILLLLTSLFYYENLIFLVYAVLVLFVAVTAIVYSNSKISLNSAIRLTLSMFIASLPIVVVLFFTFPRVSFKSPNFGFKAGDNLVTGFGEEISIDKGKELLQSDKVAMEIMFDGAIPKSLYFRGAALYSYKDGRWSKQKSFKYFKKSNLKGKSFISYTATIYPTQIKSITQLDYPLEFPKEAKLTKSYTLRLPKPLFKTKRFKFKSILDANLSFISWKMRKLSLALPPGNPKTKELAKKIKNSSKDEMEILDRAKSFFISSKITYTLSPPKLNSKDKIDEFLFKTKKGYCVYFASSFAYLLRAAGIPARVIVGYKADKKNLLNNYLVVRAKDAHSWVEAYINDRWIRLDPTKYALIPKELQEKQNSNTLLKRVSLELMYIKYKIEEWVLYYSRLKQIKLLKMLKENKEFLIEVLFGFLVLVIFSLYFSKLKLKREDKLSLLWGRLLRKLKKSGFEKMVGEGDKSFAKRLGDREFERLTWIYLQLKYDASLSKSKRLKLQKELKRAIKSFRLKDSSHK